MAGLSGIVKKISDLVTGTPADDDCFVFGKSDLKKITLAKLKDALGITSINSALADMRKEYLKRYYYQSANAETWKAFNIALPASISNYGHIPLLAILGTNIYILNITSQVIGSSLTDDGVLFNKLLGSTEIYITAVKEGSDNHVRIKFTIMNEAVNLPVSIYSLREGVTIDSAWFSQS